MIIIIDEASAKLASFYYHGEIFKLQWRSVAGKASMSEELQEKLYGALPGKVLSCRRNCQMSSRIICVCMK